MKDIDGLESIEPESVQRVVAAVLAVIEREEPMVVVMALSGIVAMKAHEYKAPQDILDYASAVAQEALKDIAAFNNPNGPTK